VVDEGPICVKIKADWPSAVPRHPRFAVLISLEDLDRREDKAILLEKKGFLTQIKEGDVRG
jgi:hypothetical protein